jgi:hypothetical protein
MTFLSVNSAKIDQMVAGRRTSRTVAQITLQQG